MPTTLASPWFKVLIPLVGLVVAITVARIKGVSFRNDLGLRMPSPSSAAFWFGIWAVLIVLGEIATQTFGLADAERWQNRELTAVLMRALPLVLLGPVLEELAFRGFLFFRLSPRLGPLAAVLVLAVAWALLHYRYGFGSVALLAVDGTCLGLARWRSGSLLLPMAMHIVGNGISVAQSLAR